MKIDVYCDGLCSPNPGEGTYAYVILKDGKEVWLGKGFDRDVTNQMMELQGAIEGIKQARTMFHTEIINVFTDSQYVQKGFHLWSKNWVKNGWVNYNGDPVKNKGAWVELLRIGKDVIINWVKGHNGDKWNERCDEMANAYYEQMAGRKPINYKELYGR